MSDERDDDQNSDKKDAYNEKTVVQSRHSAVGDAPTAFSQGNEKTVVYAQSNLKETFDARTVVRFSKPTPPKTVPVFDEPESVVLPAVVIPAHFDEPEAQLEPTKGTLSREERRAQRAALDRKTRTMIAAFAALCVLVILCFLVAFGGSKSDKVAVNAATPSEPATAGQKTDLSSEAPLPPAAKAPGADQTTTDVLMKFDRAAQKAQEHALDYSKSSTGF
jgi:hypothetical protein